MFRHHCSALGECCSLLQGLGEKAACAISVDFGAQERSICVLASELDLSRYFLRALVMLTVAQEL